MSTQERQVSLSRQVLQGYVQGKQLKYVEFEMLGARKFKLEKQREQLLPY